MEISKRTYASTIYKCRCGEPANCEITLNSDYCTTYIKYRSEWNRKIGIIRGCENCVNRELRRSALTFMTHAGHDPGPESQQTDEMNVLTDT